MASVCLPLEEGPGRLPPLPRPRAVHLGSGLPANPPPRLLSVCLIPTMAVGVTPLGSELPPCSYECRM